MRILILTEFFPPEVRSAAHLLHDLARELTSRQHEVAVITKVPTRYVPEGAEGAVAPGWGDVGGVRTFRVGRSPLPGRQPVIRGIDHLLIGWRFGRASLQWPGAEVVLAYSPPVPLASAGIKYGLLFDAPLILNVQDLYPQTAIDLGLLRNPMVITFAEGMERRAYERAARIVVHSPGNRSFLVERKNVSFDKVRVIYNWVNTESLRPGPRENSFRMEHGLGAKFVVSYAGLMGYAQDLSTIIECAALMRHDESVMFLLVGEGVLEDRWKTLAADRGLSNVRFLPMQSKDRYAHLLAASDVCLVPLDASLRTPVVPGKLQSIMACGRPSITIVDGEGDTPKLVEESGGGINVRPGDAVSLASTIQHLKNNPGVSQEMGQKARAFAEAHFSLTKCADTYEELFSDILNEKQRAGGRA